MHFFLLFNLFYFTTAPEEQNSYAVRFNYTFYFSRNYTASLFQPPTIFSTSDTKKTGWTPPSLFIFCIQFLVCLLYHIFHHRSCSFKTAVKGFSNVFFGNRIKYLRSKWKWYSIKPTSQQSIIFCTYNQYLSKFMFWFNMPYMKTRSVRYLI